MSIHSEQIVQVSPLCFLKVITTQTDVTPHHLLAGGLKSPPDYNRLQQVASLIKHLQGEDYFFC